MIIMWFYLVATLPHFPKQAQLQMLPIFSFYAIFAGAFNTLPFLLFSRLAKGAETKLQTVTTGPKRRFRFGLNFAKYFLYGANILMHEENWRLWLASEETRVDPQQGLIYFFIVLISVASTCIGYGVGRLLDVVIALRSAGDNG
jgi:hypothetical protein